ncbi:MAG: aldehyde dehydrogenase family protein, partial [Terriglobales bacterium]
GAINIVAGGAAAAEPLLADERVAMISFTGSAAVGWALRARAGSKHVALELGGNAANIVHADADLDWAASRIAAGGFGYAGQSCISAQRVFAAQSVYAALRDRLVARAQALRLGDPLDPATEIGPMITDQAARRAEQWIREAVAGGARLLCGGQRDGGFLTPAVLENARPEMSICREEAFAPLLVLEPYAAVEEAFAAANASRYGLQAGIFTRDWDLIWRAFRMLEVGGVVVNDVSASRAEPMPYGGVKQSGLGREGLRAAIEDMTELHVLLYREPRA